jgi:hypothetical protein
MCFFFKVKRRLDFQTETANVLRRTEQKHMVDWIISNVRYITNVPIRELNLSLKDETWAEFASLS